MVAEISNSGDTVDDLKGDSDFLTNVPRIQRKKVLDFGHGSGAHGRDSRYWDRDDRRRDDDYDEDMMEQTSVDTGDEKTKDDSLVKMKQQDIRSSQDGSDTGVKRRGTGLYNEAGRHELKRYEAEYEASLKNVGRTNEDDGKMSHGTDLKKNAIDAFDDEYDDFFDFHDSQMDDSDNSKNMKVSNSNVLRLDNEIQKESHVSLDAGINYDIVSEDGEGASSLNKRISHDGQTNSRHASLINGQSNKKSHPETKKKSRRRKFSGEVYIL